jgi:hypothetical protein
VNFVLKVYRQSKPRRFRFLPNNIGAALNSVRFCRLAALSQILTERLVELTVVISRTLHCYFWPTLAGTTLALLLATLKDWLPGVAGPEPRLGFRFWGVNSKRGLAPAPFFHFCAFRESLYFQLHPARSLTPFLMVSRIAIQS